jgi:S-adenosylmethionine hydrolase
MLVTLTTDFGLKDWFVGTIKGVIQGISAQTTIIDLTHEIRSGDIRAGAFALAQAYQFFPRKTIHVAVVDPGVGSSRAGLAVQTERYFFVGPDNGVLSWALAKEKILTIRRLENRKYFLPLVSHTFHGRDVFAPVAGHLSKGVPCEKVGPEQKDFIRLPWPETVRKGHGIQGEVVYIDHFGNAITDIPHSAEMIGSRVLVGGKTRCYVEAFYQAVAPGKPVAVPGSSGFVEIAVNGGNASQILKLKTGSKVTILH